MKASIVYNTVPLQIKCKYSIPPISWMWCLIFDAKFRIRLNEKLLCVGLSSRSEADDRTLNMESHSNILERSRSTASNAVGV